MATQLQFSRHAYDSEASLDGSDAAPMPWGAPHRHVAFAVHGAVPSPQLLLQRERRDRLPTDDDDDRNTYDTQRVSDLDELIASSQTARVAPTRAYTAGRSKAPPAKKLQAKQAAKPHARRPEPARVARKPGWDSDARSTSNLFDATLKKSVLFQPRPGDRLREVKQEEQSVRAVAPMKTSTVVRDRGNVSVSTSKWNARIAASVPAQQPRRRPKDYVKMNMEKITGQRYETLVRRAQGSGASRPRGSVFERLSAPVIHKSLLRFRSPSPTRTQFREPQLEERGPSPPLSPVKLTISSPVVSNYVAQEARTPPPRGSVSSNRRSSRSSPTRERASTPPSTRRSTLSRASSPGFRSDRGYEQITMTERVFEVLDRQGRGRIGVEQILDGLRLLQLPATHNQVADYVYLIHEGEVNTIDYEEWAILVGTLDAASESAGAPPVPPGVRTRSSPQATRESSPPRSRSSQRTSPPRSLNQVQSPQKPSQFELRQETRDWSRQEGSVSMSVKMPQSNIARIAKHSEDLAELMLEDLLLDTVEDLNKQERAQTSRKRQYLQAEALSSILQQIEQIEAAEAELIDNGFALGYNAGRVDTVEVRGAPMLKVTTSTPSQRKSSRTEDTEENLSLPLGIVMSVNLDGKSSYEDSTGGLPEPLVQTTEPTDVTDTKLVRDRAPGDEIRHEWPGRIAASMSCLSGRMFQSVEKNRVRFMKHRQLVESSLESTGMDQAAVIEMLADLLLDEIALECAVELETGVEALTDTLAQTLL